MREDGEGVDRREQRISGATPLAKRKTEKHTSVFRVPSLLGVYQVSRVRLVVDPDEQEWLKVQCHHGRIKVDKISDDIQSQLSANLSQLIDKVFKSVVSNSKSGVGIVTTKFQIGFEQYVSNTKTKCENVKTLISTGTPVSLSKAYEPVDLILNNRTIGVDEFISSLSSSKRAVITATLGAGKSFTLKYIYSKLTKDNFIGKIPVFVDLRKVDFKDSNIIGSILSSIAPFSNWICEPKIKATFRYA